MQVILGKKEEQWGFVKGYFHSGEITDWSIYPSKEAFESLISKKNREVKDSFGQKLYDEQEKCSNYSFDRAEQRYGTEVASPHFEAFNHYRMSLYAQCEGKFFQIAWK